MKIGYRTVKTSLGAALSIFIAQWLQLDFYVSAGILTILCIQPTKKSSVQASLNRFIACLIGMLYSFIIFEGIGYFPISLGLLLITFIPLLVYLKIQSGFITSVVIITHIFTVQNFTLEVVYNELLIIIIGIGIALILNLYMPNLEKDLRNYQIKVEDCFRIIFKEYASYLENGDNDWTGKELLDVDQYISGAKTIALKDIENHLIRPKESFYYYFSMRERQLEILERMLPLIISAGQKVDQRNTIADYLRFLSCKIHPKDTVNDSMDRLKEMRESIRKTELPKTREEFETRASLFHLIQELELYLKIKEQSFQRNENDK